MKALTFITFLLVLTLFATKSAMASPKVKVVVEHWPPWEIALDKKKQNVSSGVAVDLLKELFARLNMEMELTTVIWARALIKIETGDVDLIPMITFSKERNAFMVFTDPVYVDSFLFAYSTNQFKHFQWQELKELAPYKIGATRGYHYSDSWKKAIDKYQLKINYNKNDISHLKMLLLGRIDLAPLLYSNAQATMSTLSGYVSIQFSKKPLATIPMFLGISRKSFLISKVSEINQVLKEMREDGTYKKILKNLYLE